MHYYANHVCGTWEEEERYRVLGGRVAVHSISVYLLCCHNMQVWVSIMNTVPFATGVYSCMIVSTACAILSNNPHTTFQFPLTFWWIA